MNDIPRADLLALAREFLKLELLLAKPLNVEQLRRFLILAKSLEESGGVSALKAVLRPEHADSAGLSAARSSAVCPTPKEAAAAPVKDASHP